MDTPLKRQPLSVRPARPEEIPAIMAVLEVARGIMRTSGNLRQWVDGYPSENVVRDDIRNGFGHVVVGQAVAGYFAFIPSPEPTYAAIYDGAWLDDETPYHVIHRIGSLPEVHGVFSAIMDFAFSRDRNIRIDTHRDNGIMQHNLLKYGFSCCGIIFLTSGDERLAYQRIDPVRRIRKAGPGDIALIRGMADEVFRETYRDILSPAQMEYMMDWMYAPASLERQMAEGHSFQIAMDGDTPCGYCSVRRAEDDPDGTPVWELEKLYVLKSWQGRGWGGRLFAAALAQMSGDRPSRMFLHVNRHNPAVRFYEKQGLRILYQKDFPIGDGYYMNDYIMGKERILPFTFPGKERAGGPWRR